MARLKPRPFKTRPVQPVLYGAQFHGFAGRRRRTLASVDDEQRPQQEQDNDEHQQAAFRSICAAAPKRVAGWASG